MGSQWNMSDIAPHVNHNEVFNNEQMEQYAIVYDLLSEGEIEGLVAGPSSVFLNGTPLVDERKWLTEGLVKTEKASIDISTNAAKRVTVAASEEFFDNRSIISGKSQYMLIEGAGKSTSTTGATFTSTYYRMASVSTVTASQNFFNAVDVNPYGSLTLGARLKIEGAGEGGSDYYGWIVAINSATQAIVTPKIGKTVAGATGAMDHFSKVVSIDAANDYCTLEDAALTSVTNTYAELYNQLPDSYNQTNEDDDYNFNSVGTSLMTGTLNQEPFLSAGGHIPTASFLYLANTEIKQNSDYKSGGTGFGGGERFAGTASDTIITSANIGVANAEVIDKVKFTFNFPQGLFSIDHHDGDEGPNWSELQIFFEYQQQGETAYTQRIVVGRTTLNGEDPDMFGWGGPHKQKGDGFIIADSKLPFSQEFEIDINQFKPFDDWRFRVKKVNADNFRKGRDDWTMYGKTVLSTVQAVIEDKLSFPGSAYAVTTFSAKDFSTPPQRSYEIKGIKIQVPTNYLTRDETGSNQARYERNVTTGADAGSYQTWDGNFRGDASAFGEYDSGDNHKKVFCDNPAWVFYDLCTNPVYGLGNIIKDRTLIDKYELFKIARYCDELVDDGKGGTEPRFTCNTYIAGKAEAFKVLSDLASIFRGMPIWTQSELTVTQDRPKTPSYVFTQSNVVDGTFTYQGSSNRQRPNQIAVTWQDPDNEYKSTVERVEDVDDIINSQQITTSSMTAFGCTSQGQARRLGEWNLITSKNETEIVTFTTGINASFLKMGDVIEVQDSDTNKIQFSGRVSREGTLDRYTVSIDRNVDLYPNSTYMLHMIFPSGAAFLTQDFATISGVTYLRNDVILKDKNGADIDTEAKSVNIVDDDGNTVNVEWSGESRVEKQIINFVGIDATPDSTSGKKSAKQLPLITGFSEDPEEDYVWIITSDESDSNEAEETRKSKKYTIVGIVEDSELNTFDISALELHELKYDQLEKGWATYVPPYILQPERKKACPQPGNISITFSRGADFGGEGTNEARNMAKIEWQEPVIAQVGDNSKKSLLNDEIGAGDTSITLKNASNFSASGIIKIDDEFINYTGKSSNTLTGCERGVYFSSAKSHRSNKKVLQAEEIPFADVAGYEVKHNLNRNITSGNAQGDTIRVDTTSLEINNPKYGYYDINVRAIDKNGKRSAYTKLRGKYEIPTTATTGRKDKLPFGGVMTGNFLLNESTGMVNTAADNYTFINNKGKEHIVTSATTAQEKQTFSGLSAGETGYLVHDSSDTTDPWKALVIHTHRRVTSPTNGATTTLAEGLTSSETDFDLADASSFGDSGRIVIGSEEINYTGKSSNTLTGCTRAVNGTTASSHSNGATVYYGVTPYSYWKEVGASTSGLTLLSGTITVSLDSNKVTGSGTSFTSHLTKGDLIKLSTENDASEVTSDVFVEVDSVISNTVLYLKSGSPRAFTSKYIYKQSWQPKFEADSIVAKITRNS